MQHTGYSVVRRALTVTIALIVSVQPTPRAQSQALDLPKMIDLGPIADTYSADATKSSKDPIFLIPGEMGSQLKAKLNRTGVPYYTCSMVSDWFDAWVDPELMENSEISCLIDNLQLRYDNKTRLTTNTQGVEIRTKRFGCLEDVDNLNSKNLPGLSYFNRIITTLVENNGYTYNLDIVGIPFDFRKAPNELEKEIHDWKVFTELFSFRNDYKPVTIICFSMGCLNTLYMVNNQSEAWKERYVRRIIALSAPWGGSFKAITAMLYGDNLGIPFLSRYNWKALQSTFPSTMYLFPREMAFSKSQVLIETPKKNYTLENLEEFFFDADLPNQREMWLDTMKIATNLKAPNVELWCLHGDNFLTPSKIIYTDSLNTKKYKITKNNGDGTVNLSSLRACEDFGPRQDKPVYLRVFHNYSHSAILKEQEIANYISAHILAGEVSTE